jgi:hypothetical protein
MLSMDISKITPVQCWSPDADGGIGASDGGDDSKKGDDKSKEGEDKNKQISQDIFNKKMSELRAQGKAETDALMKKFSEIQNRLNLSEREKEEIAQSLEETRTSSMTEKQRYEHQLLKIQEQLKAETTKLTEENNTLKSRFEEQVLQIQIQDAVGKNKGIDPDHFLALVKMYGTKVKEIVVDDKPTGQHEARVAFPDLDKDQKPVVLDLSVDEVVKRMAEMKKHQHLFNHGQVDGTGLRTDQFPGGKVGELPDFSKMTTEQYEVWRKQNVALVGE